MRLFFKADLSEPNTYDEDARISVAREEANLIGSRISHPTAKEALHMPLLDIDDPTWTLEKVYKITVKAFPQFSPFSAWKYVPSSTSGHWHAYIDIAVTWPIYALLIDYLGEMGVLEEGWVRVSLARKCTYLRILPNKASTSAE